MKIEDYGFIGDTETGALVGRDGSIDWLCVPRFDSEACFAALLGTREHGFWRIAPIDEAVKTQRRYRGETLILETETETPDGVVRLIDFMPPRDGCTDLVRIVEGVRGRVKMQMKLVIRFNYGASVPWVRRCEGGVLAVAGPDALLLGADVETRGEDLSTVADFEIAEGERRTLPSPGFPRTSPRRRRSTRRRSFAIRRRIGRNGPGVAITRARGARRWCVRSSL